MRRRDGGAPNGRMNFVESRMQLFRHLMSAVPLPIHILDVGGTVNFWEDQLLPGWELTIINIIDQQPLQGEIVLVGNGCDLPFDDYQYDVDRQCCRHRHLECSILRFNNSSFAVLSRDMLILCCGRMPEAVESGFRRTLESRNAVRARALCERPTGSGMLR
jgi:hypothetical protein